MKKFLLISVIVLVFSVCVFSNERFIVSVVGNFLSPADSYYKEIYGSSVFDPELKAGYKIVKDVYIWAGYGFLSKKGTTPTLGENAKATQNFVSSGIGYNGKISGKVGFNAELGLFFASYREEAMEEVITGSATGFGVKGEILYGFGKGLFIKTSFGYTSASDEVEDVKIKLGGMKAGIGVEVRF